MEVQKLDQIKADLAALELSLDEDSYQVGRWQTWLDAVDASGTRNIAAMGDDITRVSNKLHGRHQSFQLPFRPIFAAEIVLVLVGCASLISEYPFLKLAGVGMLAMGLQPLIKVLTGLWLGVSYAYVYFLNFEPRFKMNYGSYMSLPGKRRVILHLSGALGTPLAMLAGYISFRDYQLVANGLMILFILVALMQVGAFAAVWLGYPRVAGYRLENLTSPAKAAAELRRHQSRQVQAHEKTDDGY